MQAEVEDIGYEGRFFKIILAVMLLVILALAFFREFDHDEFEAVHSSWKMLNGEAIYIDFFQHHHPFFYYLIQPILWLFGESIVTLYVLRLLMFFMFLGMLWVVYRLALMVYDDEKVAALTVVLLSCMTMFAQKAIEIRPDVPQVLLGLTGVLFMFQSIKLKLPLRSGMSALCIALSYLFLQKTVFIVGSIGIVQLFWIYERQFSFIGLIKYWLVFGLAIMPYYGYLFFSGEFENYLFYNWILNMHFEGGFSAFRTIIDSLYYNHFIWLFGVGGFILFFNKGFKDISLLGIVLFASVFVVRAPYRQYFMPFLPVLCMMAAYTMIKLLSYARQKVVVGLIALVPMIYLVRTIVVYPNSLQLKKIEWVLNQTDSSDYVYDGDIYFNLFRRDIDYFWYSTEPEKGGLGTYQKLRSYNYDLNYSIQKYRPKIVSNTYIDEVTLELIMVDYKPSLAYPDLYIRGDEGLID